MTRQTGHREAKYPAKATWQINGRTGTPSHTGLCSSHPLSAVSQYLAVFCFNQQLFLARWGKPRLSKIGNPESLLSSDSCQELHSSRGEEHKGRTKQLLSASLPGMGPLGTRPSALIAAVFIGREEMQLEKNKRKKEIMRRCTECWAARMPLSWRGGPARRRQALWGKQLCWLIAPHLPIALLIFTQKKIQESPHYRNGKVPSIISRTLFFNLEFLLRSI